MGMKLLVFLTAFSILGLIYAPFYFMDDDSVPHYEWLVAMGVIAAATITFVGIRTIIFEIRMKKLLNQNNKFR